MGAASKGVVKNRKKLLNPDEHLPFFILFDSNGYNVFDKQRMSSIVKFTQKLNRKIIGYAFSNVMNDATDLFAHTTERYALASTLFYRERDELKLMKSETEDPQAMEIMLNEEFLEFLRQFLITNKPELAKEIPLMRLSFAIDQRLCLSGDTLEKLGVINKAYASPEGLIAKLQQDTGVAFQKPGAKRWMV
jgi:hypothetical protein